MKSEEILTMRGPNQWSAQHHHLLVIKVRTEEQDKFSPLFFKELHAKLPGLAADELAKANPGEIMGRVMHELLKIAGMEIAHYELRPTREEDLYRIIIGYESEEAALFAARLSIKIVNTSIMQENYDPAEDLEELRYLAYDAIGPTTSFILSEVRKRGIPYKQFEHGSLVTLGYGNRQKKMRTAVVDSTSGIGIELAGDKEETKTLLHQANIPVPKGVIIYSEQDLLDSLKTFRFPVVLKPLNGNHGRGVTTNINTFEKAVFGFHNAQKISRPVILEEFIEGEDHRFLVIDYKLVAVAMRTPAMITGDGHSTIKELIDEENKDPQRGDSSNHVLSLIKVDVVTEKILADNQLTLESVLPDGKILYLKDTANISAGGTSTDVTDNVHPENKFLAERIARMFSLNICGIDILTADVSVPLTHGTGAIIEVNAGPGIRMHTNPTRGTPRNVAKPIVDMLFPDGNARIPVIAVTGTNGKTTTTRLIAHLAAEAGYKPGYATSEGIYIQDHLAEVGDCTGAKSAQTVLFEPTIDFAVLECARGGIIRTGLGFDKCDISIVTNITEDHLGTKDIHTVEEMAKVKAVVASAARPGGYSILNADDDLVYNMQGEIKSKAALFSMNADSKRIRSHYENGGIAATVEDGYITIYNGEWKTRIDEVKKIPLTLNGRADCMVKNILPAVIAIAIITDFDTELIRKGLRSFIPSPDQTPGRFNIFRIRDFELMVDYAHNTDGLQELKKFMDRTEATAKVGIIAATGDRRDEDIRMQGKLSAEIFDELIIRNDKDLRGRTEQQILQLLHQGIEQSGKNIPVKFIRDELEAIKYAVEHAQPGSLIVTRADEVFETLEMVKKIKQNIETQPALK